MRAVVRSGEAAPWTVFATKERAIALRRSLIFLPGHCREAVFGICFSYLSHFPGCSQAVSLPRLMALANILRARKQCPVAGFHQP